MQSIYCPRLIDQAKDETRIHLISYMLSRVGMSTLTDEGEDSITITESMALKELVEFLTKTIASPIVLENLKEDMRDILAYLNYVGKKEFEYATSVLAQYYKDFLDSDADNQILIKLMSDNYNSITKSDIFVLDGILSYFSAEEMIKYRGRILRNASLAKGNVKVVVLDDWSISGDQLKDSGHLYIYGDSSIKPEINLLIAKKGQLDNGYSCYTYGNGSLNCGYEHFSVFAPLIAREKGDASLDTIKITGFHSSVDYGFEEIISRVVSSLESKSIMPPLTNIIRPYRCKSYVPNFVRFYFNSD